MNMNNVYKERTNSVIMYCTSFVFKYLGWAMQVGAFMFIKRKWEEDKVTFSKFIKYFADINYKTQVRRHSGKGLETSTFCSKYVLR